MQALFKMTCDLSQGHDIEHAADGIDDRGADDAHIAVDIEAAEVVIVKVCRCTEVDVPQRPGSDRVVRVESVDAVATVVTKTRS